MNHAVIGALINSALYFIFVFVAALVTAHPIAWKLAIIGVGIVFFSHVVQLTKYSGDWAHRLIMLSWLVSAGAGLALLF